MSKVFNMVGGGGKNISSIIITGLESTDTVTCTKDGKNYTAAWDETAHHFEVVGLPLGAFTITATNGTNTKTETVLIDIAGVYEVEMSFKLWLYKDGVPYDFENFSFNGQPSGYGNNFSVAGKATTKKIDLSKYSKICCESDLVSNEVVLYLPVSLNIDDVYSTGVKVCENQKGGEYSLDGINEARYVAVGAHQGGGTNCTSVIEHDTYYEVYNSLVNHHNYFGRIWLE